jgi:RHS repeat-associated protein
VTVDENGQALAARQYDPWGGVRGEKEEIDDLLTDYTYTGQRSEAALGLMYYVARWYDSGIGHFVQADTIVPGAGNPMAHNRYAYVAYNPLRYTDPTGHLTDDEINSMVTADQLGTTMEAIMDIMDYKTKKDYNLAEYLAEKMPGMYAFLSNLMLGDVVSGYSAEGYITYGQANLDDHGLLQFGSTSLNHFRQNVVIPFATRNLMGKTYISHAGGNLTNQPGTSPILDTFVIQGYAHQTTAFESAGYDLAAGIVFSAVGGLFVAPMQMSAAAWGGVTFASGSAGSWLLGTISELGPAGTNYGDWTSVYRYSYVDATSAGSQIIVEAGASSGGGLAILHYFAAKNEWLCVCAVQ